MSQRFDYRALAPGAFSAMIALGRSLHDCGIDPKLLELVKLRASQINGCAYCLDMHSIDARALGETEQRIYVLDAWREAPSFYTERERAALAWTEAVTRISDGPVPDEVYEPLRAVFTDAEVAALTFAVVLINGWNRLAVASRAEPGHYRRQTED